MDAVCISVGEAGGDAGTQNDSGYVLEGDWDGQDAVNAFLNHLAGRGFSAATVRAYAFDVANLSRFLVQQAVGLAAVDAPLVFDWIDWQGVRRTDQPTGGHRSSTRRQLRR
ncbi:site-specific integrase [Mycobacterium avium]|uniref:site-specific integrase n=1 Tax=Mycobacterium avium TaxID=1764 RepID=UPI0020C74FBE|nr:site-specific integrase [Mycobacterium avium]